ncbi:MAG: CerR family C-terminal domain-containing protein [Candidatus Eisenbacteria bacterium]|nr:CerR family C-terminal domain-containing protein [Candidatus Eisenbacteria bacterium]
MRSPRSDGRETRQKILEAASEVFAEVGYTEGTVSRIREAAGVNQAAVSYHFGGKEDLYREVWEYTAALAEEFHPLEHPEPGAPAEERLRFFLSSHIKRILDEGAAGRFSRILVFEIHDPQPFLAEALMEGWKRKNRAFETILRDFLGEGVTPEEMEMCRLAVLAPCMGLGMHRMRQRLHPLPHRAPPRFDPDALADHLFRFARAGLLDLKDKIAGRGAASTVEGIR